MTRTTSAVLVCDADSVCGDVEWDYYEQTASTVGGVSITAAERAPGWTVGPNGGDLCPEHAGEPESGPL